MRVIVCAVLLCLLLQACGSKGALVMPGPAGSPQQSDSGRKN